MLVSGQASNYNVFNFNDLYRSSYADCLSSTKSLQEPNKVFYCLFEGATD